MSLDVEQADEPKIMEPEKCEEWRWVDWPAIPRPIFQPLKQLLESKYHPDISYPS